ncbi:MAG TPA: biopolymer transporter ExbD [Longimicrobiaceae bacterium]|nr:biopolymer transporter ExbD [Longimicrobiaceae bacterium]
MAMGVGGSKGGPQSEINMTPMIDVLLVLLIIFMVVQQGLQRGLSVQVPPVKKERQEVAQNIDQIVLDIQPGPRYFLNQEPIQPANLETRIREVFAPRPRKVIFVKGAENLTYGQVIHAIDATRAAGVEVVGLVPRSKVNPVAPAT